jgi:hypothetical protein
MSLYKLPVSVDDLTQLQSGIEFFTNVTEATNEAALINADLGTPTVFSYAKQLLGNNISLSQVAMAVDSLMFGVTDNVTELGKLATQFLPPQVSNAVKYGLNPTVYAAEALGLGLAGGNGTSTAFASKFGSLSVSDFASAVSNLTGINAGAIQNFAQNWISFYTANPSATGSLSVTLASYGAAFGDAVGAALLNPTVNGTLALVTSEVQNALIDNAEGFYKVGIPIISEPPHLALQGEAFLIPDAGGAPLGATIDWAAVAPAFNYALFTAPAQTGPLTINNAPSTFTLNTQHYGTTNVEIDPVGGNGNLLTLILGDSTTSDSLGAVEVHGYSTVNIVANGLGGGTNSLPFFNLIFAPPGSHADLVISGSGNLDLGNVTSPEFAEGTASVTFSASETIIDDGVTLRLAGTNADKIDASNAPRLIMTSPADTLGTANGVTVLGGASSNILQGSLGSAVNVVTFSDGISKGVVATDYVGADNITGGSGGKDWIFGDGGPDAITLPPNHSLPDYVYFGQVVFAADAGGTNGDFLAITDGSDQAYLGSWGASKTPTAISNLFPGSSTGGTSADMTTITGFHAGSSGDSLWFSTEAWNGASILPSHLPANGDLVALGGTIALGLTQLSTVWLNHTDSNPLLKPSDNVLLYAPGGGSPHNAQQLAAQLHGASGEVVLPGDIAPGQHLHILVAYDASLRVFPIQHVVNIADVDLVNTSGSPQNSTNNLNVYASDMVHLTGVSLTSLTSDNIFLT